MALKNKPNQRSAAAEERVSLIAGDGLPTPSPDQRRPKPKSHPYPRLISTHSNNSISSSKSVNTKAKKRSVRNKNNEEHVSLLGNDGRPTESPARRRRKEQSQSQKFQTEHPPWSFSRLMRYLSLTAVSSMVTFIILRKESKVLHWEEYNHLLEPDGTKDGQRCYQLKDSPGKEDQRCTCPDPTQAMMRPDNPWKFHHMDMVRAAQRHGGENSDLDIVFLGDSIVERWNGTKTLGSHPDPALRRPFEQRFTKQGGGDLEGLALGSAGATGPNILWHLEHGVLEPLNPKFWLLVIGSTDLFESECTDRFVVADILNVLRLLFDQKPGAHFIVQGILPRKDRLDSKSQFMGYQWKRAQAVNYQVRKFCEKSPYLHYMQAGSLFTEETLVRGRRQIDKNMIADGIHPTVKGLEVWGDYIIKFVKKIQADFAEDEKANEGENP